MNGTIDARFNTTVMLNMELVERIRLAYDESNEEIDRLLKTAIEYRESFINGKKRFTLYFTSHSFQQPSLL